CAREGYFYYFDYW
nr:immunoglobulin heavy chain junction region [Mus musculus]